MYKFLEVRQQQALIMVITSRNICTVVDNYKKGDHGGLNALAS